MMKVNHLSMVIWNRKIITECTRSFSSTRIGQTVLMMDIKISEDKHICRWIDWENPIYVWRNSIKITAKKTKKVIDRGKKGKTLNEVKPVENSKNPQSFLEILPGIRKFLFVVHINCMTMHISNRILWDKNKITTHRELFRINSVIEEILIQGKINTQQNSNEDLKYW